MEWLILMVCVILLTCYMRHDIEKWTGRRYIKSTLDNKKYGVLEFYNVKGGTLQDAANKLAELNLFLLDNIEYMKNKYLVEKRFDEFNGDVVAINDRKQFVQRLVYNYDPDALFENSPTDETDTSYVLNKGESMNLCLREADSGEDRIHDMNMLKYVALHELAHIGSAKYGHGLLFWSDFKFIIKNAKEAGLYHPIDYKLYPDKYCGVPVTYNPYFDENL